MKATINAEDISAAWEIAQKSYTALGVNAAEAVKKVLDIPVSIHCWQGDDVTGFENSGPLSGGILATGNYPGRARNGEELRSDAECAFSLIPGKKRFNLHSLYAETGGKKVSRDKLEAGHFSAWMDWSAKKGIPLDFNPSLFSHPQADSGFTLSSASAETRRFWIDHAKACRRIAAAFGENQKSPAVNNLWIPDGSKDYPADRLGPRKRLLDALDEIFAEKISAAAITDTVESKLFGIGSEAYVTGSHEFYMGYAVKNKLKLCLDTGHFHSGETISDKISALLLFLPGLLIHFSRGLRWDSDHVATFSDEMRFTCQEIRRSGALDRMDLALDYFDASINRIAAWVIGGRNLRKALLEAYLEPVELLEAAERNGKNYERLALLEECKTLPFSAVWDKLCLDAQVPVGTAWLERAEAYERQTLAGRV